MEYAKPANDVISPYIIFPFNKEITSKVVSNYSEIVKVATLMVARIQANKYKNRRWPEAYAMAHTQVYCEIDPLCATGYCDHHFKFFVVNMKNAEVKKMFSRHEVIINPIVIDHSPNKTTSEEACMSNPFEGIQKKQRYEWIEVEYKIPTRLPFFKGKMRKVRKICTGLKSNIFQHEIDHFNGIC